ncbi:tyrosine-type recombinase/integrase [Pseudomonadota bacterium]
MPLTDISIKAAKPKDKQYKMTDGEGMYLLVHPNGGKYWRLKYRINGKEKCLALGAYPLVSLLEAREKRFNAKKKIADGIDPSQEKKLEKLQRNINSENNFEAIAREWHKKQTERWTERHAGYVLKRLEADIFKEIGYRPIIEITPPELLVAIQKIEKRGAIDVAQRTLQTCGQIFRFAVATGRAERDITTDLKGALTTRKKTNYSRLKESELPEFFEKLEKYDGDIQTKLAIKFLILTFVRTKELRGARWEEFNFDTKEWHIPAERMKMRQKHIVPLSKQVLEIIKEIREIHDNQIFLFPNKNNPNKTISENTVLYAIYRLGYHSRTTAHGFRGTASTILNEKGFNRDHIERQLAHSEGNSVRASYNHADYLPERHKMMQWWADYLDKLK